MRLTEEQQKLVEDNIGFAHYLSRRMAQQPKFQRAAPEDIEAAGLYGLCRGAASFDPSRGVKFTTYAAFSIRTQIQRAVEQAGAITLPPNEWAQKAAPETAQKMRAAWACIPISRGRVGAKGATPEPAARPDLSSDRREAEEFAKARYAPLLAVLSPRERTVVEAHYLDGLSMSEAGRLVGVPKESAQKLKVQAVRYMREAANDLDGALRLAAKRAARATARAANKTPEQKKAARSEYAKNRRRTDPEYRARDNARLTKNRERRRAAKCEST